MKIRSFLYPLLFLFILAACTNAPKSDEAKTTEAKEVSKDKSGETRKVNAATSKIEWIGTKVTGYHTGDVPVKSGELYVKNGEVTGGTFIMDLVNMKVSGPKGSDSASNDKLLKHLKSSDFFDVEKHQEARFDLTGIKPFTGSVKDTTDPRQ